MKKFFDSVNVRKTQLVILILVILVVFGLFNTQVYYFVDGCTNPNCPTQPWSTYELRVETKVAPTTWTFVSFKNEYIDSFRDLSVGVGISIDSWTD